MQVERTQQNLSNFSDPISFSKLTKNEIMIILQKYNKSFIDKCNIANFVEFSQFFQTSQSSQSSKNSKDETFDKFDEYVEKVKKDMTKLKKTSSGGMTLVGTKDIEYFIYPTDDSVKIQRKDNLLQAKVIFSLKWDQYARLLRQLIDKNLFMSEQENNLRIFSALLLEKYNGTDTIGIELSSKKKELASQLTDYFKNLYSFSKISNILVKYNAKHKITSAECFKNKVLIDKEFCDGLRNVLRYEFDIVPLNGKKTEYLKKLIPCAVFIEDINEVRKKCDIYRFVGDWVVYQNEDYKIDSIVDKNIKLIPATQGNDVLYIPYKQFKTIQENKKELSFEKFEDLEK